MVTVNTTDKYINVYETYKKSLAETKLLEYTVRLLERNLTEEDLEKLVSVVPPAVYERIRRRTDTTADLPWNT